MSNFLSRVAKLNPLATRRLGGESWMLRGEPVEVVYNSRYARVNFGDERFKNVDMTGVGINSTGPAITLPTNTVPEGLKRGDEVHKPGSSDYFTVVSLEHDNGMTTIILRHDK